MNLFLGGIVTFLIILSVMIGYSFHDVLSTMMNDEPINETTKVYDGCENLTLEDTAECMREFILPFYKYNLTNDSVNLTLEDLKLRGGDCKDWAELYVRRTPKNYYGEKITIKLNKKLNHAFYVLSNKEGYCVLDQETLVKCSFIKNQTI